MEDNLQPVGVCQCLSEAKSALRNKWLTVACVVLIVLFTPSFFDYYLDFQGSLVTNFVQFILFIGLKKFYLDIANRSEILVVENIWSHFKPTRFFVKGLIIIFLYCLGIVLCLLLFIIPGIYFGIVYSQVWFILIENPDEGISDIFKRSSKMMRGKKCTYLLLVIASIGIYIAGFLFLMVGLLFAIPLVETALAVFYLKSKTERLPQNIEASSFEQA